MAVRQLFIACMGAALLVGNSEAQCTDPPTVVVMRAFATATNFSATLNAPILLRCSVSPETGIVTYMWQRNGRDLELQQQVEYTISSVQSSDGGEYRCGVTTATCVVFSPTITITTPPTITDIMGSDTVAQGDSIELMCSAEGYPVPTIEWDYNGVIVHTGENYTDLSASLNDSGIYTCIATNTEGNDTMSRNVTVLAPPASTVQLSSSAVVQAPASIFQQTEVTIATTVGPTPSISSTPNAPPPDDQPSDEQSTLSRGPFLVFLVGASVLGMVVFILLVNVLPITAWVLFRKHRATTRTKPATAEFELVEEAVDAEDEDSQLETMKEAGQREGESELEAVVEGEDEEGAGVGEREGMSGEEGDKVGGEKTADDRNVEESSGAVQHAEAAARAKPVGESVLVDVEVAVDAPNDLLEETESKLETRKAGEVGEKEEGGDRGGGEGKPQEKEGSGEAHDQKPGEDVVDVPNDEVGKGSKDGGEEKKGGRDGGGDQTVEQEEEEKTE